RRALPVRGTLGARAGAGLGHVAGAGGRATLHARGLEGVGRAVVAHPVAALGDVARARRRAAGARGLPVRGTAGPRAGARLGHCAAVARPVAAPADVERPRAGTTDRRALPVRATRGARAGAGLGHVAGAGGRATLHARGLEGVGRAIVAQPVAALGDVARARRGTTHRRALPVRGTLGARACAGLGHVAGARRRAADRPAARGVGRVDAAAR